jgi:hypothetical protein
MSLGLAGVVAYEAAVRGKELDSTCVRGGVELCVSDQSIIGPARHP